MDTTYNIMFVDDEQPVLDGIRRALSRKLGGKIALSFFREGFGALREIERRQPDILVTDMMMPGMSGKLLLGFVQARFPGIRTFILSGQYSERDALDLVGSNTQFLHKPFDSSALQKVLEFVSEPAIRPTQKRVPNSCPEPSHQDAEGAVPRASRSSDHHEFRANPARSGITTETGVFSNTSVTEDIGDEDGLSAARGILFALPISLLIWASLAVMISLAILA